MMESIFLNIIINGLYTFERFIVVAADLGGMLKCASKETTAMLTTYTK